MLDLNDFKPINDKFGHQVGDHALIAFAWAMKKTFASEKMVARYAGDEFLVVTHPMTQRKVEEYKVRLHELLDKQAEDQQYVFPLTCSMAIQPGIRMWKTPMPES